MVQVLLDAHWDRGSKNKEVGGVSVKGVYQIKKKKEERKDRKGFSSVLHGWIVQKVDGLILR